MKAHIFKRLVGISFVAVAGLVLLADGALAQTELTVYTAIEADDLKRYAEEFNKDYPDIEIKWVRDSTGIVTAKLLAEKDNPQADVVWGLAATSLMVLKNEGMTHPYMPEGGDALDPKFIDSAKPPHWTGMDAWVAAICVNTIEAEKNNLPMPTSWMDLVNPVYKGHVVMPNPNSSGTGFLDVASWLQLFGEEDGWGFMDALHENIAWYTHSGSKPCRQAGAGETPIGISFAYRGAKVKNQGAPIEIVVPSEGVGWDGGDRHRQGHQESRRGDEAGRLFGLQDRQRDVQLGLCRYRLSGHRHAGGELSGCRGRRHDRQQLRMGGLQSQRDLEGVAEALRLQVGTHELALLRAIKR